MKTASAWDPYAELTPSTVSTYIILHYFVIFGLIFYYDDDSLGLYDHGFWPPNHVGL